MQMCLREFGRMRPLAYTWILLEFAPDERYQCLVPTLVGGLEIRENGTCECLCMVVGMPLVLHI